MSETSDIADGMIRALQNGAHVFASTPSPNVAHIDVEGACRWVSFDIDHKERRVLYIGVGVPNDAGYVTVPAESLRDVQQLADGSWSLECPVSGDVRLRLKVT